MKSLALATGVVAALMAVGAPSTETPGSPAPSPEVLREIAKIQEQLGGSIVNGSELEGLAPPRASSPASATAPNVVSTLREVAWQLDKGAHQLERVDLYAEADDLRKRAQELRQEARDLKSIAEKPE